jgi:hypothetical protein
MDRKELIRWLSGILARGLAWFFAVKLGIEASQAGTWAESAAEAIGSLVLVGVSIYTSISGRRKLLGRGASS